MVVSIGAGRIVRQHPAFRYFAHKHHMTSQVLFGDYLAREHRIGVHCHIQKTVMTSFCIGKRLKFIYIPAGLHTKMANRFKRHIFCQHTDIENAGIFDHFSCEIAHLDGNCQLCGVISYLEAGVGNTAIIFVRFPGTEYKQSVGQIKQRLGIFRRFLLLNESSAPADPAEPCRGELRHEPSREQCRG